MAKLALLQKVNIGATIAGTLILAIPLVLALSGVNISAILIGILGLLVSLNVFLQGNIKQAKKSPSFKSIVHGVSTLVGGAGILISSIMLFNIFNMNILQINPTFVTLGLGFTAVWAVVEVFVN